MNEKVKAYLEKRNIEIEKEKEKEKKETLAKLGLVEKEFLQETDPNRVKEYPYYMWDEKSKANRQYRYKTIEVTDEEYQEILKVAPRQKVNQEDHKTKEKTNNIGGVLRLLAWVIYILGGLGGIISEEGIVAFVEAFVGGTVMLGLAEIIQLLQDIKNK